MRNYFLIIFIIFQTGCSTFKGRTLLVGATSFAACSILGASVAPDGEKKSMHAIASGSVCSSLSMGASEIIKNYKNEEERIKIDKQRVKDSVSILEVKNNLLTSSKFNQLDKKTREDLKGEWDIYKVSIWVSDGRKLIHEDLHIKFKKDGEDESLK